MIIFNPEVSFAIYALSGSFSFFLICVGISYLRTTQYHRYDSQDFIDNEEGNGK